MSDGGRLMWRITASRVISAPRDIVFKTVADINEFSQAVPRIQKFEFLSPTRSGVGTRFRETSLMKGRAVSTELEVTDYVPNERVRLVADSDGVVWDTVFAVTPQDHRTLLTMTWTFCEGLTPPAKPNPKMPSASGR